MSIFSQKLYSDVLYKKTYKNIIKMEFCFFIYLNDFEKKKKMQKNQNSLMQILRDDIMINVPATVQFYSFDFS